MRRAIVPTPAGLRQRRKSKNSAPALATRQHPDKPTTDRTDPPTAPPTWAGFEVHITLWPLCGGQLHVIADITDPQLIRKNLDHVQPRAPPPLTPGRAEPHRILLDLIAEH
jgi:hypothetical protein